jgi:hypothetical protein
MKMKKISQSAWLGRDVRLPHRRGWAERLHGRRAAELQGLIAVRHHRFSLPQLFAGWAAPTRSGSCIRPASCAASLTVRPGLLLRRLRWSPIHVLRRLLRISQGLRRGGRTHHQLWRLQREQLGTLINPIFPSLSNLQSISYPTICTLNTPFASHHHRGIMTMGWRTVASLCMGMGERRRRMPVGKRGGRSSSRDLQ